MKNKICKISLFPLILACVSAMPSDARVTTKTTGRSYADAYQQVNALRFQQEYMDATATNATTASATANLPVAVSDEKLAAAILDNTADGVTMSDLENCAMIYPNGVFKWDIPESGVRRNQIPQCVAVVELRNATTNALLATTTVAAGDTFKCNIDSFPESGMSFDVRYGKVELPGDVAPTIADVEAVMNEEQKQNAGLKIAAAAIIGGVAGNFLAPKEAGDTKMFGTGQTQLLDTAIGTATGAGIMAASSYSGKVAGDTIKSTAVNAASGMVLGNVLAGMYGGDVIMATGKCSVDKSEHDCVIGSCVIKDKDPKKIENGTKDGKYYFIKKHTCNEMLECDMDSTGNGYTNCTQVSTAKYTDIRVKISSGEKTCSLLKSSEYNNVDKSFVRVEPKTDLKLADIADNGEFLIVSYAEEVSKRQHAYAVVDLDVKPLGYKMEDWADIEQKSPTYYYRNTDGTLGSKIENCKFEPDEHEADDGNRVIDISDQARAKGTMAGTAVAGAMGGFSGYQGAKTEVEERWVSAVREYNDSLNGFVCSTGGRFLSKYNDYVEIQELKKSQ